MKQFLFIAILLSSPAAFAASPYFSFEQVVNQATPTQPVCYGREYSESHLAQNRAQTVKKLRAKIVKSADAGEGYTLLKIDAELKGEKNLFKVWRATMFCQNSSGHCSIECDGGSVNLRGDSRNGNLLLTNNGFVLEGGCEEEEGNTVFLSPTKGGDDLFSLKRLPSEFCAN